MKEELKEVENPNKTTCNIFSTTTGLYLQEPLCNKYNVGDKTKSKTIKQMLCFKINIEDITKIKENENINLEYETIFDLQLVLSFTVYVDIKHNNKLYIIDNMCEKYNIKPISKRIIEGSTYCNVTEGDIKMIEDITKNEQILLKSKYVEINLNDETKPAEYLFIYYYSVEDKTAYVQRNILELAKKSGIEIEGKPKIIENKNCYSITEEQLKEIENKTQYHGVEKIIKPKLIVNPVKEQVTGFALYKKIKLNYKPESENILFYQDIHSKRLFANLHTITRFNIETTNRLRIVINNEDCYEITREDYLFIINNANNNYSPYKYSYNEVPLGLREKVTTVIIYKDIRSKKLFAKRPVLERFNLPQTELTVDINNETCYEIAFDDAVFIIETSNNKYAPYIVKVQDIPLGIEKIIPYNEGASVLDINGEFKDSKDRIIPVNENTNNLSNVIPYNENASVLNLNGEFRDTKNRIIPVNDRIEVLEDVIPYNDNASVLNSNAEFKDIGNRIIPTNDEEQLEEVIPYNDNASVLNSNAEFKDIGDRIITIDEEEEQFEEVIPYDDNASVLNNNTEFKDIKDRVIPYNEFLKKSQIEQQPVLEDEKIVVYRDTTNNKLYIPAESAFNKETGTKTIMGKLCYETSEKELESTYNKIFIITDVYPAKKNSLDVIICNNNGKLFVSRKTLSILNFYIENPHRIKVNKEIFEEITTDDVDLIRERENENLAINIIFKHITPTRKRG